MEIMKKLNSFQTLLILQKLRHKLCTCSVEELKWLVDFIYEPIKDKK